MLDHALHIYGFTLGLAGKLVDDVADDQMCAQPVPGRVMNHGAFLLGHLAWTSDQGIALLRPISPAAAAVSEAAWNDAGWKELFAMGAKPLTDRSRYPSKAELLSALADGHSRFASVVGQLTPEDLAMPTPERMRTRFPTIGVLLTGLMTSHEASHLGQLSAWRRALGWPSLS
jgi:DinB superfamily